MSMRAEARSKLRFYYLAQTDRGTQTGGPFTTEAGRDAGVASLGMDSFDDLYYFDIAEDGSLTAYPMDPEALAHGEEGEERLWN